MLHAFDEENSTHAVLLVDDGGTILDATPAAERLLQAEAPARLPAPLAKWLAAAAMNETRRGDESLIFTHHGQPLRAHLLPAANDQLHAIVVAVVRDSELLLGAQALGLSRRECQVIELAGCGAPTTEIARRLGVSTRTVQKHLEHIYRKLGAVSRAHAIQLILQRAAEGLTPIASTSQRGALRRQRRWISCGSDLDECWVLASLRGGWERDDVRHDRHRYGIERREHADGHDHLRVRADHRVVRQLRELRSGSGRDERHRLLPAHVHAGGRWQLRDHR
jgi:DNA-binding CsgD family transcriptional regulator